LAKNEKDKILMDDMEANERESERVNVEVEGGA